MKLQLNILIAITAGSMVPAATLHAETITIGKGRGIAWEGMPFNQTLSGPLYDTGVEPTNGLLAISLITGGCISSLNFKMTGGYWALPIQGIPGVGLVPRASGSATYTRFNGTLETLRGTIGLPETRGTSPAEPVITSPPGREWCLPPVNTAWQSGFYSSTDTYRTATLSGTWAIVADGTQTAAQGAVQQLYFISLSRNGNGIKKVPILPTGLNLRISTLECTVNTPVSIDFGSVNRDTRPDAELAVRSVPLVTTCGQPSDMINANINLQLRALSGIYNAAPARLALNQGGGYVTGEINNGVTGSGACNAATGLPFNNTPVKLGSITAAENSKTISNQLTWRLCSGGSSLPTGAVTASAEMLVTFN